MPNGFQPSWCAFDLAGQGREAEELEQLSLEPGFWDDGQSARDAMQRLAALRSGIERWSSLRSRVDDLHGLVEIAAEEEDEAFGADAQREFAALRQELEEQEFALSFSGPYDDRPAILAIHAGAGGTESQDWAEMLLRMYLRWAERRGFRAEVLDRTEGEEAGIKSATVEMAGAYAYGYIKAERGVHRLVRLSPYDSAHARHTSFALVEVLPEADDAAEVSINTDDLRIDVFRASGHGGQNVQKNSTAVRITHIPSGIVVTCQNERSQGRNRDSAMKVLRSRLLEIELQRRADQQEKLKGEHVSAGWANQIRSYVLHPYKMVKDHRTDFETSDTAAVLDGDLDPLLQAYHRYTVGAEEEA